jgi:hypothetical protein
MEGESKKTEGSGPRCGFGNGARGATLVRRFGETLSVACGLFPPRVFPESLALGLEGKNLHTNKMRVNARAEFIVVSFFLPECSESIYRH